MSQVAIATLPWGVVQNNAGDVQVGTPFTITLPDNTPVASGTTNSFGEIPGTLATGVYKLTVLGRTKVVHVVEADVLPDLSAYTTVASFNAHANDAAADGGPHGFPALTANGQTWVRTAAGVLTPTDVATQAELDAKTYPKTFRLGHTFAVAGVLTAGMVVPGFFVPEVAGQAASIVEIRHKIVSGTSIGVQLQLNGVNSGSVITVTPTATTTNITDVALANGDLLSIVLSAATASPADLSFTLFLEHVLS